VINTTFSFRSNFGLARRAASLAVPVQLEMERAFSR
jgi:hypothetical protein